MYCRFAIVPDTGLAKLFPKVTDQAEQFCLRTELVLEKVAASRMLHNYRQGDLLQKSLPPPLENAGGL